MKGPIELVAYSDASPYDVQPRNSSETTIMGVELEVRKKMNFLGAYLDQSTLGGNVSFIQSKVQIGQSEYESRVQNARTGETIDDTRALVDQSHLIANIFLQYSTLDNNFNLNFSQNYQGKKLAIVGIGRNADVHTLLHRIYSRKLSYK